MDYRQTGVICGKGSGPTRFAHALRAIAVDREGLLYAVGDQEVKVLDPQGRLVRRWPTQAPGYCVAVHPDGTVFVGEPGRVEMFSATGDRTGVWEGAERFGLVTTVAFLGDEVFIADAKDRCIRRLDRQGQWKNDIGEDNRRHGFIIPNSYLDFDIDADGKIRVCHSGKLRVEQYDLDGKLLGHFGKFGGRDPADFRGCCNPTNLAVSSEGHVVVTEKAGPRMKVYDASGKLLAMVGEDAFHPECKNMDVAVDGQGNVYVVDTVKLHICVFAPQSARAATSDEPEQAATGGVPKP